jgi:hypothetical protein
MRSGSGTVIASQTTSPRSVARQQGQHGHRAQPPTQRRRYRLVVALLVLAVAAVFAVASRTGGSSQPTSLIGAYTGSGADGVAQHETFARWTGGSVPFALDYGSAAGGWSGIDNPTWILNAWQNTGVQLVLSVPMFPKQVTAASGRAGGLQQCSSGGFNEHWAALGNHLVSHNLARTIVRPGWEMNGDWFDWSADGHEADYIGCFRQIVTTMRAVPGQNFTFNWNPAGTANGSVADGSYPGNGYVDQIGVDVYDWVYRPGVYDNKASQTPARRQAAFRTAWQLKLAGDHGLNYWASFAAAHGKPLTIPEWGLADRLNDNYGGGDDPYFIQHMFDFVYHKANNVAYAIYFNTRSSAAEHRLLGSTAFPQAAGLFRQLVEHPPGGGSTAPSARSTHPAAPASPPPGVGAATAADQQSVLLTSSGPDRQHPRRLGDDTVKDSLYAWVKAPPDTLKIEFRIDDPATARPPVHTELDRPFDLGGTSGASVLPYSVAGLADGTHTLTATLYLPGHSFSISAPFDVSH